MEQKRFKRFDEPPFLMGRVACGINALIDMLGLQIDKLKVYGPKEISEKLVVLSSHDFQNYVEVYDQSILLQDIIDKKCKDDQTKDEILALSEEKFRYYLETRILK